MPETYRDHSVSTYLSIQSANIRQLRRSPFSEHGDDKMKLTPHELDGILASVGLLMAEPYNPRNSYAKRRRILTTCSRCGTTAHYSLETIEKGLKYHETVCKACYWKRWY